MSSHPPPTDDANGDDDGEVTEEEEEEEDEPRLKYQRLGHTVSEILKKDAASCLAAHEKFLVRVFLLNALFLSLWGISSAETVSKI